MASALREKPVPGKTILIGDVSLTGEVKRVPAVELRLREAERLGFETAYVPAGTLRKERLQQFHSLGIREVRHIFPLLRELFGGWESI
jgi:DNA repair protein RadA/Sms